MPDRFINCVGQNARRGSGRLPDTRLRNYIRISYRFAVEWFGIEYIEKESAFGYYTNPNGIWDWYEIGGRWPYLLLVKDTCREYFSGQISWTWRDETVEPPRGYRWTSGARMRDIEWQAMWAWHRARQEERFGELEDFYI